MGFCTVAQPQGCLWHVAGKGVKDGGRVCSHLLTRIRGRTGLQVDGLMGAGMSLQGHLNWPPFCLVMLNVTHLAHQVTIDRFNRKVSASKSRSSGAGQHSVEGQGVQGWRGLRLIHDWELG